jgi:hypothetical protein
MQRLRLLRALRRQGAQRPLSVILYEPPLDPCRVLVPLRALSVLLDQPIVAVRISLGAAVAGLSFSAAAGARALTPATRSAGTAGTVGISADAAMTTTSREVGMEGKQRVGA